MIRKLILALAPRLIAIGQSRAPDFVIGEHSPGGDYLHLILRSDDDRALHDHPWINLSVLLSGYYVEHSILAGGINRRVRRDAGDLKLRLPSAAHRLEVEEGAACWTLFITGPRLRPWGFHCPQAGFTPWRKFTAEGRPGDVGPGCDG